MIRRERLRSQFEKETKMKMKRERQSSSEFVIQTSGCVFSQSEAQRGRRRGPEAPRPLIKLIHTQPSANGLGVMRPAANEQNKRRRGRRTTKRLESAENDQQAGWR